MPAQRGRVIAAADDRELGGGPVAVISDRFWERRFARDPSAIGRTVYLNGALLTIVGVAGAGFDGLTVGVPVDVYVPLVMQQEVKYHGNASSWNADTERPWLPQERHRRG